VTINRYRTRKLVLNDLERYKDFFDARGVSGIRMFRSGDLRHPTAEDMDKLTLRPYRWTLGDKFFKLAHEFYGDSELWWVIAWFNRTPTEAHVEHGDLIYIPFPLEQVVSLYRL
tara:strand:- start:725 stop:1066 length:342 start_codon:yes stop_codon:yes gene_type:complete